MVTFLGMLSSNITGGAVQQFNNNCFLQSLTPPISISTTTTSKVGMGPKVPASNCSHNQLDGVPAPGQNLTSSTSLLDIDSTEKQLS